MLLEVKKLKVIGKKENKEIIKGIDFSMEENTCTGILGESGSGKSITCKSILNVLNGEFILDGEVIFQGEDILKMDKEKIRKIRGKDICMILQNPMTSFNPLYTIGNQMTETFIEHIKISKKEALNLAVKSMNKMKLEDPEKILKKYPHELSGGMLQRIMIAVAMALKPKLIIADEPTTAIDSLNQKDIIEEFMLLKKEMSVSILFVTHDLGVLSQLADSLIVMKNGEIVEKGKTQGIMKNPVHEHTKFLIDTRYSMMDKFKKVKEC